VGLSLLGDTSPYDCACGADLWSVTDASEASGCVPQEAEGGQAEKHENVVKERDRLRAKVAELEALAGRRTPPAPERSRSPVPKLSLSPALPPGASQETVQETPAARHVPAAGACCVCRGCPSLLTLRLSGVVVVGLTCCVPSRCEPTVRLEARQRLAEHTGAIHSIVIDQLSRETLFTASEDKTIRVWTLSQQTDLWKCSQVGVWVSSDLLLQ
jgi:hypothetical protein